VADRSQPVIQSHNPNATLWPTSTECLDVSHRYSRLCWELLHCEIVLPFRTDTFVAALKAACVNGIPLPLVSLYVSIIILLYAQPLLRCTDIVLLQLDVQRQRRSHPRQINLCKQNAQRGHIDPMLLSMILRSAEQW
jgi:hypothetical protein